MVSGQGSSFKDVTYCMLKMLILTCGVFVVGHVFKFLLDNKRMPPMTYLFVQVILLFDIRNLNGRREFPLDMNSGANCSTNFQNHMATKKSEAAAPLQS